MRGYFYEEREMASRREQQIEEDLANGQWASRRRGYLFSSLLCLFESNNVSLEIYSCIAYHCNAFERDYY